MYDRDQIIFFPGNPSNIHVVDCFSIRYFIGLFDFIWELEPRVGDYTAIFNGTTLQVYCDWWQTAYIQCFGYCITLYESKKI